MLSDIYLYFKGNTLGAIARDVATFLGQLALLLALVWLVGTILTGG